MKRVLGIAFLVVAILFTFAQLGKTWNAVDYITKSPQLDIVLNSTDGFEDETKDKINRHLLNYERYDMAFVYTADGTYYKKDGVNFCFYQEEINLNKIEELMANAEEDVTRVCDLYKFKMRGVMLTQEEDNYKLYLYTSDYKKYSISLYITDEETGEERNYSGSYFKDELLSACKDATLFNGLNLNKNSIVNDAVEEALWSR